MCSQILSSGLTMTLLLAATDIGHAANPIGLLVTPAELQDRDDGAALRILDVRALQDFEAGHLPGAIRVDVAKWKELALTEGGLTNERAWARHLGVLGIGNDTSVVVYGGSLTDATRIWWTLKYVGVKYAGVLDGGFAAWRDAGAPVDRAVTRVKATQFRPDFQADRLADLSEVRSVLQTKSATIIDTRSDAEFAGAGGSGARWGHIPGAVHHEWTSFVTAEGRFKPVAEIKRLLSEQGLTPQTKAITHCQTGGRASLNAFAMELAGFGPVKNYYCGWSEWSGAENVPIEKP